VICASLAEEKLRRMVLAIASVAKKALPGTKATRSSATARARSSAPSMPVGSVSQTKSPPSGWVHSTPFGIDASSAAIITPRRLP